MTALADPALLPPRAPRVPAALAAGAALWWAGAAALAAAGAFDAPGPLPLRLIPAVVGPALLLILAHRLSPAVRAWVAGLDPARLAAWQAWRVVGLLFLFVWGLGLLPAAFAVPAALGDLLVAALAVPAALAAARAAPGWERRLRALTLWGLADFAVVFACAALAGPGMPLALPGAPSPAAMQVLPLAAVPVLMVPAFLVLHALAWLRLAGPALASAPASR